MDIVGDVEEPAAVVLRSGILRLKYNELIPEVREEVDASTRAVAQGNRKIDLDVYLSIINVEALKAYGTW